MFGHPSWFYVQMSIVADVVTIDILDHSDMRHVWAPKPCVTSQMRHVWAPKPCVTSQIPLYPFSMKLTVWKMEPHR